jgi:hypothetical protein
MPPEVALDANVDAYFREIVESAAEQASVESTEFGLTYVSALLSSYVRLSQGDRTLLGEPLTLALHRAASESGARRVERLRAVGDTVLYAAGFFEEHLTARGVSLPYVRGLGARAYELAASTFVDTSQLFLDLAERFDDYARVLRLVSDSVAASSAGDGPAGTLLLYERWMKTRSPAAAEALIERGLLPTAPRVTLH